MFLFNRETVLGVSVIGSNYSLLKLTALFYKHVFYQREFRLIISISVAVDTLVLSLSTDVGKLKV